MFSYQNGGPSGPKYSGERHGVPQLPGGHRTSPLLPEGWIYQGEWQSSAGSGDPSFDKEGFQYPLRNISVWRPQSS
jgi:hypothetical protein